VRIVAPQRWQVCPSRCSAAARTRSQDAFLLSAIVGLGFRGVVDARLAPAAVAELTDRVHLAQPSLIKRP
jgi:hypothetical protein